MIRQARFADITQLAALLDEGHQRSRYAGVCALNAKEAKALFMQSIQRHGLRREGGSCVFVSEGDGQLDGLILGMLEAVYHVGDKLSAKDVYFYVSPGAGVDKAEGLANAYFEWADGVDGVIETILAATDVIEDYRRVAALYRRWGLTQVGVIYERRAAA